MNNIKIGIVVADVEEYKPLAEFIEKGEYEKYDFLGRTAHKFTISTEKGIAEVISILCGIGKVNAAAAAMHLVDIGCCYIMNYGLSGGISEINKGEISFANRFLEHDFDLTGLGYAPCEKPAQKYIYQVDESLVDLVKKVIPNFKVGTAVSGDRFICDEKTANFFRDNYSAMTCDMETAAIAYVADASKIPFICLRKMSDDASDEAGDSYTEMNNTKDVSLFGYVIEIIKEIAKL